ncbi:MAG: hypothetical protein ACLFM9_01490 [Candidatus Aenigmatarchaeota archaeon]
MKEKGKKKSMGNFGFYLLGFVAILYAVVYVLQPGNALTALSFTGNIALQVIPIFAVVILFMVLVDYYLTPEKISGWIGHSSGAKGWLIAITTGTLSHGPIFVWYSLLEELKEKGMRSGLIAVFLYNRAIKLPLLPMLIFYFGIHYSLILLTFMVLASVLQGLLIDHLA